MILIMNTILIFITIILLVYFFVTLKLYNENTYVKSDIDHNNYLIRQPNTKGDDYLKTSANTLAEINKRITKLIDHLDTKYTNDENKNFFIKKLKENYNSNVLSEAAIDNRYTTYTIDKQDMHICLRTRDSKEEIYDINLLMYVILHELAHLCNYNQNGIPIQGHGDERKNIFKLLVVESILLNIYTYVDYTTQPEEYCGIMISSTILPNYEYEFQINDHN
jgi:hypothetical protein